MISNKDRQLLDKWLPKDWAYRIAESTGKSGAWVRSVKRGENDSQEVEDAIWDLAIEKKREHDDRQREIQQKREKLSA